MTNHEFAQAIIKDICLELKCKTPSIFNISYCFCTIEYYEISIRLRIRNNSIEICNYSLLKPKKHIFSIFSPTCIEDVIKFIRETREYTKNK